MWRALIDEINRTADGYVLAVSGGVDSMFLAHFFAKNCRVPFRVAQFDHGLREGSDAEQRFVGEWCARAGVAFAAGRGDPDAMRAAPSLEAEARRQRWAFMDGVRREGELCVTAHHANDQLETVMLRLMRGYPDTNLRMRRVDGTRYKPLLGVTKEEILAQAANRRVEWVEDPSNASLDHERNWVRHTLVPQMMERRNVLKTVGLRAADELLTKVPGGAIVETRGGSPRRG